MIFFPQQQQPTPMNVGGGGPGGNMMTMNMQVSISMIYRLKYHRCFVYEKELALKFLNSHSHIKFISFNAAANVWAAADSAASATESAANAGQYNGTNSNDFAGQPNGCSSNRNDEFRDATTATATASE